MAKKKPESTRTNAGDAEVSAAQPYVVLARKYRPQTFDDLIGQEAMVKTLRNAFASDRIAQAYMLTGVRGVGKTTTARIIARALNYETDAVSKPTFDMPDAGAPLRRDHREPASGRDRDGCGVQYRRRQHARDHRERALQAARRALQGVHHRRSPHALEGRLQRASEDAGGAAGARQVHLCHHRDPQGAR